MPRKKKTPFTGNKKHLCRYHHSTLTSATAFIGNRIDDDIPVLSSGFLPSVWLDIFLD